MRLTFFCIDEPVGSGNYQELMLYWIHPRIHQGAKQDSAMLLSGDQGGPGTGDEIICQPKSIEGGTQNVMNSEHQR